MVGCSAAIVISPRQKKQKNIRISKNTYNLWQTIWLG